MSPAEVRDEDPRAILSLRWVPPAMRHLAQLRQQELPDEFNAEKLLSPAQPARKVSANLEAYATACGTLVDVVGTRVRDSTRRAEYLGSQNGIHHSVTGKT